MFLIVKTTVLAIVCVSCTTSLLAAQDLADVSSEPLSPQIMNAKSGKTVELDELVAYLKSSEIIFLGEQHDNDAGHEFQLKVIQSLVAQGADVAISMEQFERDVQGVIDDYLANRITEEQFLESSRPWKNYAKHYRAIIEFAKEKRLPVLAANIPRKLAAEIAQDNTIKANQQVFLPRTTTAPEDLYWQNFLATMKGHVGAEDSKKLKSFYKAQCMKDDAMAESITDYIAKNPHQPKTVVHLCGHFHSDYGLGTAFRVMQRNPLLRIAVVTMETIPDDGKLETEGVRDRGHYIFWTVKNPPNAEEIVDEKVKDEEK